MDELNDSERATLDFERLSFPAAGAKEQAIGVRFGIGATTYYQRLNAILDRQAALAYDPVLVGRLRARRARQQRSRSARRSAGTIGPRESDPSA